MWTKSSVQISMAESVLRQRDKNAQMSWSGFQYSSLKLSATLSTAKSVPSQLETTEMVKERLANIITIEFSFE